MRGELKKKCFLCVSRPLSYHPCPCTGSNPTDTINGQGKLIGGPRSIKDGPLQRPADPVEPETPDAQAAKRMRK